MKLNYLCLGSGMKKDKNGFSGTAGSTGGDWSLLKCFYEEKGRYGEFYFNFNKQGDAEISKKDDSYANALLFGLAEEFQADIYEEAGKVELIDWNKFSGVLVKLSENTDKTISRHAKGLLKSLKL